MSYLPKKLPTDKLGQYLVTGDIAEGTFGKVKIATHVHTGQRVALKYLSRGAIAATRSQSRVQREVECMRVLKHPNIIKLYEVISTPKYIIIVLEYAGGELFNYIQKHGKMPEYQARRFFHQLIAGIGYSHNLKIVHRDLKPENILLDDQLNVKIADFGLSNVVMDGEFLQTSCGSPNYAAPEVVSGLRYTGPEIDVWSCGVILYVMLCASLPFEDDNVNLLFAKIQQGHYYEPPFLSQDAKELLADMLVVDPVKRATIPEILQSNFFKRDVPQYLKSFPSHLPTFTSPQIRLGSEIIEGLGYIDEDVVQELADSIEHATIEDVWDALRIDDGVQGNVVKVAYMLLRDKQRGDRGLTNCEEPEGEEVLRPPDSPNHSLPPTPSTNIHSGTLVEEDTSIDLNKSPPSQQARFTILSSSLPSSLNSNAFKRSSKSGKEKKPRNPRWHFGIRSRSPRMEVMLEIYRALKVLGMEWKEKRSMGSLSRILTQDETRRNEWRHDVDDNLSDAHLIDSNEASSIYFVETRTKIDDIVILMDLQLYQVDDENYLVDFKHQGYYKASIDPVSLKFDRALSPSPASSTSEEPYRSQAANIVSPFLFMDVACRLIIELVGGVSYQ